MEETHLGVGGWGVDVLQMPGSPVLISAHPGQGYHNPPPPEQFKGYQLSAEFDFSRIHYFILASFAFFPTFARDHTY